MLDSLYKGTYLTDTQELLELLKASLKKCTDFAMTLGKLNQDLLTLRRDSITAELNIAYKHLSFPQGEHPKLLFGDDLSRLIKEITETNKVGQCLSKKNLLSSPNGSNISLNSNSAGSNSDNKSFFMGAGVKRKIQAELPAEQSEKQSSIPFQKQPWLLSLDHCYAKDPCEEVDFRKQANIITENLKTKNDSFTADSINRCMKRWKEITSDKWIFQTFSKRASIELEGLASIPLITTHKTERLYLGCTYTQESFGLLQKNVIKQVENSEKGYVVFIFLREKKDKATHRLILNLKKFNENVVYPYFKMGSLRTVLNIVTQGCYMASIDLTDAYYTVPVLCTYQKYLLFQFEGNLYKYTCL